MVEPSLVGMLWAIGLMAIAIGLASWQRLGLTKTLVIATGRTLIQLLGVGLFLATIFASRQPLAIFAVLLLMATIAAAVARNRIDRELPRLLQWVWIAIFSSAFVMSRTNAC